MPELPEVETVRAELEPWLVNQTVQSATLIDAPDGPKYADLQLAVGGTIEAVARRGKFLILPLSNGHELVIHLGMTGVVTAVQPEKHTRVRLTFKDSTSPLYFQDVRRFGRFCVAPHGVRDFLPTLHNMGPEPLSEAFTLEHFFSLLQCRVAIKTRLLSQRAVAGVGNIYADEALFIAGICPTRVSHSITRPQAEALRCAVVAVLDKAVRSGGTTIRDFTTGSGRRGEYGTALKVYGRGGEPCVHCEMELQQAQVGRRTTVWCSKCQS